MHLEGKTALVTGASRGIGRAIALKLASMGASVAINYAGNTAKAEETKAAIEAAGGKAEIFQADAWRQSGEWWMLDRNSHPLRLK